MIYHIKGDLLASDCTVIIHQSNCHMGFGSGIAGQIRYKYPRALKAFMEDSRQPTEKLGSFSVGMDNYKIIYNMYGQFYYGADPNVVYTDYDAFRKGLHAVLEDIKKLQNKGVVTNNDKIGMPYLIGCGLANGDWNIVYNIIGEVSNQHGVNIYLYEYTP